MEELVIICYMYNDNNDSLNHALVLEFTTNARGCSLAPLNVEIQYMPPDLPVVPCFYFLFLLVRSSRRCTVHGPC